MKPTKLQLQQRVEFVLGLKLQGALTWDILSAVNADGEPPPAGHGKAWGISIQSVRRYCRLADALIAKELETRRPQLMSHHHACRRSLYNRALQTNDTRTALAVLDSEAKLLRLFDDPPPPEDASALSDADLAAEIARLLDPARAGEAGDARPGAGPA